MSKYFKLFAAVLLSTLLLFGLITFVYLNNTKARYEKEMADAKSAEEEQKKQLAAENKQKKTVEKAPDLSTIEGLISVSKRVNILLMGTDGGRADTIILASYDPDRHLLDFVTVPRDTYHEVPGYDNLDQRKINAVYGFGSTDGGGKGMKAQVGQVLGVPIHFYVIADYNAVADIVNTVGGVEIEISQSMHYDDVMCDPPLHIHFEPGLQTLNGQSSIEYLRWRKNNGEYGEGDIPRTGRQMDFIKKLISKSVSSLKYDKLMQTCYEYVSTDMPLTEVLFYATTLFGFDPSKDIESFTLPGDVIFDGLSYYAHDASKTSEVMKNIYSKGLVQEKKPEENSKDEGRTDKEPEEDKEFEKDKENDID